ncbi:hypothetical protein GIB67_016492, partial [Kingdonia uniflora]
RSDVIASVKAELGKPITFILTKERYLYLLIAVLQHRQCLRIEEAKSCLLNFYLHSRDVYWAVKV